MGWTAIAGAVLQLILWFVKFRVKSIAIREAAGRSMMAFLEQYNSSNRMKELRDNDAMLREKLRHRHDPKD